MAARPTPRRDRLVDTALRLFAIEGFHGTGIDRILAESGVSKMTLYKHFPSKDDLILAALRRRDESYRAWLETEVAARIETGEHPLVAYVHAIQTWCDRPQFNGCTFINAAGEFGDPKHPVHRAAGEHKQAMLAFVEQLARDASCNHPQEIALQTRLLCDGATVMKQAIRSDRGFEAAAEAVKRLANIS
ncbi:MAG: TetR/AcrR family transcriptional regulator [Parvibaculaceae bacterium]|nr:TetR/AcrR family transcriptional regulator [Parvibaculaceae bacterium]